MQEAMRVEDGSVRFPDIAAQTTSADTYRHPGLQLSRSKTTLIEPPANYQVNAEPISIMIFKFNPSDNNWKILCTTSFDTRWHHHWRNQI